MLGRPNRLEVDLDAIVQNVAAIRGAVGDDVAVCAALKANAHGHGLPAVARAALRGGAWAIAVGDIRDAVAVRASGIGSPVLLYATSLTINSFVAAVEEHDLIPTVVDEQSARRLSAAATRPITAYLKLDVGLERLGERPEIAGELMRRIAELPRLTVAGVYTHLHVPPSEPADDAYLRWQFGRFESALEAIEREGLTVPVRMAASSAVLWRTTSMSLNAVDPGRLIYGVIPSGPGTGGLRVRPALRALKTELIQVKALRRDAFLDVAPMSVHDGMILGIIPLGTVDGMPAIHSGEVLVRGHRVPTIGEPSLEHTRIDLSSVPGAQAGDEVVVIGRQGGEEISVSEVGSKRGVDMPNGLAVAVKESVPRFYIGGSDSSVELRAGAAEVAG
jgi:alanine racemase